jgi:hypothetical protein
MRRIAAAVLLIGITLPGVSGAQSLRPDFLAIDATAGIIPAGMGKSEQQMQEEGIGKWDLDGWGAGATVRFLPWLGIAGEAGQQKFNDVRTTHVLAGPRIATPFFGELGGRYFAHALVGMASVRTPDNRASWGPEWVVGGGADLFGVWRLQFDYVRAGGEDTNARGLRVSTGVVVPLCFKGCRQSDGWDVSRPGQKHP